MKKKQARRNTFSTNNMQKYQPVPASVSSTTKAVFSHRRKIKNFTVAELQVAISEVGDSLTSRKHEKKNTSNTQQKTQQTQNTQNNKHKTQQTHKTTNTQHNKHTTQLTSWYLWRKWQNFEKNGSTSVTFVFVTPNNTQQHPTTPHPVKRGKPSSLCWSRRPRWSAQCP